MPAENGELSTTISASNSRSTERKIFVGGLPSEITEDELSDYFSKFGIVDSTTIKYDRITGRSRGFGFIQFNTQDSYDKAVSERNQTIKEKEVEVKAVKSRENKKIFVGGLPSDYPEEDLRKHFETFGKVEEIEWPMDRTRNVHRNFAFIIFENENDADNASAQNKQHFGDRECDVKKATPQRRGFDIQNPFVYGGARANYGSRGGYNPMNMYTAYNGYGRPGYAQAYGTSPYNNDYYAQAAAYQQYMQATPGGYGGYYGYQAPTQGADYWSQASNGGGQQHGYSQQRAVPQRQY